MGLQPSPQIITQDEMGRVAPPIFTSVGEDAINAPGDVAVIQSLLDDRLPKPHSPIPATGECDPGTILAIEAFQAVIMGMNPPSGRVEPGSETYYALAKRPLVTGQPAPTPRFGHVGKFPQDVIDAALASKKHWNVPASITLAQWAVESAWGAAMPPGSNNPFGIKAVGAQEGVDSMTREVIAGAAQIVTARFRKFDSLTDAFDQHGRLLATGAPYKPAMLLVADPDAFADALTGVYATDPKYGYMLKWVINAYDLKSYDKL